MTIREASNKMFRNQNPYELVAMPKVLHNYISTVEGESYTNNYYTRPISYSRKAFYQPVPTCFSNMFISYRFFQNKKVLMLL